MKQLYLFTDENFQRQVCVQNISLKMLTSNGPKRLRLVRIIYHNVQSMRFTGGVGVNIMFEIV